MWWRQAKVDGPFLVLVPLSVITNWCAEFKRFSPQLRILRLHTSDLPERERMRKVKESHEPPPPLPHTHIYTHAHSSPPL